MRRHRLVPVSRTVATMLACAWMALSGAIHVSVAPACAADNDARDIRALIAATWDRPQSKVETDPVVVAGDHAVASWTQGDRGGRALLRRDGRAWRVVLCSGDALTRPAWLVEAGVPQQDADAIASRLAEAESQAAAERRAKFSLFEGAVMGVAPGHGLHHHGSHPHSSEGFHP